MVAGGPPFADAKKNDQHFKCLSNKRADIFWRAHCRGKQGGENYFSAEFKDLIEGMF